MDEILALQRELAAVQEQDTVHKLSERNCIEILMKLVELGLVKVIYTTNAKEFLTPKQLRLEIQDELLSAGGRALLSDMAPVINVDIFHIERAAQEIVEADPSVLLISGELIASWYLDGLVEEANAALQEAGKMSVASLAAQFNLPVPVTDTVVKDRLGTILRARLKNGVLYTDAFEKTQLARIRGVCSGVTRPVSVAELVSRYGFDEAVVDEALASLVKDGHLLGSLRGRDYMPAAFRKTQRSCLDAFFSQNGYMEVARASKLQVTRPLEFLRQSFPDCLSVGRGSRELVVSASLLHALEANVEEAVASRSWVQTMNVLPSIFTTEEAGALLGESSLVGRAPERPALVLADTYAVSKAFLQDVSKRFEEVGRVRGEELAKKRAGGSISTTAVSITSPSAAAPSSTAPAPPTKGGKGRRKGGDDDEEEEDEAPARGKGAKNKGGGKKGRRGGDASDDEEEEAEAGPSSGGKKGGGKKGGGGKGKAGRQQQAAEAEESAAPSSSGGGGGKKGGGKKGGAGGEASGGGAAAAAAVLSGKEVRVKLLEWHPELEEEEEEGLVDAVVEEVLPEAQRAFSQAVAAAMATLTQGDAAARRREQKQFEEDAEAATTTLQLCGRGVDSLPPGPPRAHLEAHLLRTRGAQLCHLLSSRAVKLHLDEEDEGRYALEGEGAMPTISSETRSLLKQKLPKPLGEALSALWALATAKAPPPPANSEAGGSSRIADFLDQLEQTVCPALDVIFRRLDKKKERNLVFARRMELVQVVAASQSPAELLTAAQQLVLIQSKLSAVLFASAHDTEAGLPQPVAEALAALSLQEASGGKEDEGEGSALSAWLRALQDVVAAGEGASADAVTEAVAAIKQAFAKKA